MNQPTIPGSPTVIEKFEGAKRRQYFTFIPLIFAIALILYFDDPEKLGLWGFSKDVMSLIAISIIAGIVLFSLKNWRCPGCNGYLGRSINPKFCPKCGVKLQEGAA